MVVSELVAQLEALWAEHGDVIVMHLDDRMPVLVEHVAFKPAAAETVEAWATAAHVLVTGEA